LNLGANTCSNQTGTAFLTTGTLPPDQLCAADPPSARSAATRTTGRQRTLRRLLPRVP
jgi:hypothetical protein